MESQPTHLDESTSLIPELSPGPVQNRETLLRMIIDPDHITERRIQRRQSSSETGPKGACRCTDEGTPPDGKSSEPHMP